MSFETLGLNPALLAAVQASGYTDATPVQAQAIPVALSGRDLMVSSNTGSGKTAAFMLPSLHRLAAVDTRVPAPRTAPGERRPYVPARKPRMLVLTPTRELAQQVAKSTETYGKQLRWLRTATIVGGVPYGKQLQQLRSSLDIVIGTPGRVIDHLDNGKLDLSAVEVLVLDEADRMLDMGFIDDMRNIAARTPAQRQTMLFSATFAGPVARLAESMLNNPERIEVQSHRERHENIAQCLHYADDARHKNALLEHLLAGAEVEQAIVFTSTQRDADWLAGRLEEMGHAVAALHGGMPQGKRNRTLGALRRGALRVLVATDVAARGIDVPTISHVINYGLPMNAEDYVHRIGRTGRAGRNGQAVTLVEHREIGMIRRIERFTSQPIPVTTIAGLEPQRSVRPAANKPRFDRKPGAAPKHGAPRRFSKPAGQPGHGPRSEQRAPHTAQRKRAA